MAAEHLRQVALVATSSAALLSCAAAWAAEPSRLELANPLATFAPSVMHFDPATRQIARATLPKDKLIIEVKIQAQPSKGAIGPIDLAGVSLQVTKQGDASATPAPALALLSVGSWSRSAGCTYFNSSVISAGGFATTALRSGAELRLAKSRDSALQFSAASKTPLVLCMAFLAPKTTSGTPRLRVADREWAVTWDLQPAQAEPRR